MEGLRRPPEVTNKTARSSIVTWADEAAQATIAEVILGAFPDHGILGEEGNAGNAEGPYTWIVDPLDGTSNYARGLSPWGSSIAVRETNGPLVAGVLFDPMRDELLVGERGKPTDLRMSDTTDIGNALICTGLQNDDPAIIAEYMQRMEQLYLHTRGVRCLGCPSFTLAFLAAGKVDGFVEKDATYAWDIAAAAILVEAAGGIVTDFDGGPINLGVGLCNVVAAPAAIHADLLEIVNMKRAS